MSDFKLKCFISGVFNFKNNIKSRSYQIHYICSSNDETQKANEADSKTIPTGQTRKRSPLTSGSFTARQRRGSSSSSSFSTTSTDDETDKRPRRLTVDDLTTPTNPIRIVEALEQMDKKVGIF